MTVDDELIGNITELLEHWESEDPLPQTVPLEMVLAVLHIASSATSNVVRELPARYAPSVNPEVSYSDLYLWMNGHLDHVKPDHVFAILERQHQPDIYLYDTLVQVFASRVLRECREGLDLPAE